MIAGYLVVTLPDKSYDFSNVFLFWSLLAVVGAIAIGFLKEKSILETVELRQANLRWRGNRARSTTGTELILSFILKKRPLYIRGNKGARLAGEAGAEVPAGGPTAGRRPGSRAGFPG